jgi:hypothetical protein
VHETVFVPLLSQFCEALCTEMFAAETNRADFAEKPAAMVARSDRTVSRMKIADRFVLVCKMDGRTRGGILVKFRENVGFNV